MLSLLLLSPSPLLLLLAPHLARAQDPTANVTLDDTSPFITYLPSRDAWTTLADQDDPPNYNATVTYLNSTEAAVVVNFTGTAFYWFGQKTADRAVLTVTIDGVKRTDGELDQFQSSAAENRTVLAAYTLDDGDHTVQIANEGGDSRIGDGSVVPFMAVDQIVITGFVADNGTTGGAIPPPTSISSLPPATSSAPPVSSSAATSATGETQGGILPAGDGAPTTSSGSSSGLSTGALAGVITGSVVAFAAIALLASWVARRSVHANSPEGQRKWHQNPRYNAGPGASARGADFDFADAADAKSLEDYGSSHGHGGYGGGLGAGAGAGGLAAAGAAMSARGNGVEMRPYPGGGYGSTQPGGRSASPTFSHGHGLESVDWSSPSAPSSGGAGGALPRESVAASAFSGQGGGGIGLGVPRGRDGGGGGYRASAAPSSFYSRASSIYPDERLRDSASEQPPLPDGAARDTMYTEGGWSARSYDDPRYSVASSVSQGGAGAGGMHRRTGSGASRDLDGALSIGDRARGRWLYGETP